MHQENTKRFAIIGLSGIGKSTFAILLGKSLNIPVYHLDKHMLKKKKDREKLFPIEGCSLSTLEIRFSKATDVIYFRFPHLLCLWRILKRPCIYNKTKGIEVLASKCPRARFHVLQASNALKAFLLL